MTDHWKWLPSRRIARARRAASVGMQRRGGSVLAGQVVAEEARRVLGVVAVDAEVLPVAAVGGVVVVVAVLVVDGEQVEVRGLEVASALGAHPAVQLERALAVALTPRARSGRRLPDQGIQVERAPAAASRRPEATGRPR